MKKVLRKDFFNRSTSKVARELLGKFLVRRSVTNKPRSWIIGNIGKGGEMGERGKREEEKSEREEKGGKEGRESKERVVALMITDVEVYDGHHDKASHASRGKTLRNTPMFGKAGYWYVYFTYGMHWMLNIVTEREGYPAAILIRGVADISGPARITKFLEIDKKLNGKRASRKNNLWIEDRGIKISSRQISRSQRIGIPHAGEWKDKLWRFSVK